MGKTIIEKIISVHSQEDARAGEIVWMDIDVRSARDFAGANVVKNYRREYDNTPVENVSKTFFTFDLVAPAKTIKYAINQQVCRDFAQEQGIKVYDVDMGIGSHVLMEEGHARPGATVVGTDSHMNIVSAVGAFGQGMGDVDVAFIFKTGKTWFEVPETIKVIVKGKLPPTVSAKDLVLKIIKELGTTTALGKAIEFYGEGIEGLNLSGRITVCSMVTEMSGIAGFIPFTDRVKEEIKNWAGEFDEVKADPDASYAAAIEIDVSELKPMLAAPSHPKNVHPVEEYEGEKIDSGFIGSCTNGREEDIIEAWKILKGRKIAPGKRLIIVPATRKVYGNLLKKGILQDLFDAGAIILNASCGGCAEGHAGLTGEGEIQITTGNRNFAGKQGKGLTYLASPATVAASVLEGVITSPEKYLT